ncbi:tripartite motif-containing protein 16 isoform X1 [Notolabrus celidotus]|uniref:tripartite motif-containing protein 16 isoform X1 n=1 Tax=Notolabrus celidotus TaxID=1203425 RepID=UPI00149044B1|nr:tripartite motif-containing protein 16 isoform X1 [Notolabrus celidotus]
MSDNLHKKPQVVLCDMCTEEDRKPARKTCMKCEISMCVQHLQAHLTTPVLLQTHPLTEPIASADGGLVGTTKCPQHGKLLEYYCLDDLICVCVSCAIEDQHRLHNMKTFSTAHKELREKVTAEQQALQVKTDGENVGLEKWERSEREKLGSSSVRLIEAVTNMRDLALTSVQSSVSARMVSIKTSKSSLQAAKTEEDTFRFLQMYSQVHQDLEKAKAVNLSQGLEPGCDSDKLVQEIREKGEKMMEQASHFVGSLLTHVDPETHQELSKARSDLFFEPQSLGQGVTLSKNNRTVFFSDHPGKSILLIQGIRSSTVPAFYKWRISLSKDFDWAIGLCDKNYAKELKDGEIYGLCCKGNQLSSFMTEHQEVFNAPPNTFSFDKGALFGEPRKQRQVSLQVINPPGEDVGKQMARPEKVEVECIPPNLLSFYNLTSQHHRRKIVTITINSRNQCLTPFVCSEMDELQKSSTGASGFIFGAPAQQQCQGQWKCLCGKVYPWKKDTYRHSGRMSSQQICNCGEIIGVSRVTEVLYELL